MFLFITKFCYFHTSRQGIKHAIIRKDLKIDITVGLNNDGAVAVENNLNDNIIEVKKETYVFRCGKVGPCDSLKEVLR